MARTSSSTLTHVYRVHALTYLPNKTRTTRLFGRMFKIARAGHALQRDRSRSTLEYNCDRDLSSRRERCPRERARAWVRQLAHNRLAQRRDACARARLRRAARDRNPSGVVLPWQRSLARRGRAGARALGGTLNLERGARGMAPAGRGMKGLQLVAAGAAAAACRVMGRVMAPSWQRAEGVFDGHVISKG